MSDYLLKAIADDDVRIYAAITTNLAEDARTRHNTSPLATAALGRTMTGALLLAANLKNDEAITIRLKGDGVLGGVTADAVPTGFVRGYVDNGAANLPLNAQGKLDVGGGIGRGTISVTRFTGLKEPVTGTADLTDGEIGTDIANYLSVSEQTPAAVGLGVLVDTDCHVAAAGGFFVQPLPGAKDSTITAIENNLGKVGNLSSLIADGANAKDIIDCLTEGIAVRYLDETPLSFRCHCSKRRIEDMMMGFGDEDLETLLADGQAEICCNFCGEKYLFTADELRAIIAVKKRLRGKS